MLTSVSIGDSLHVVMEYTDYTTFSIRIPTEVADALADEASHVYHRPKTRNLLIHQILVERHKAKALPPPTRSRRARGAPRKVSSTN